jgi:hypothetical protein
VFTVDTDTDPKRKKLRQLCEAREEERACAPAFPMALGEAHPHAEAWLLDDRVAVGWALGLKADNVPNVRKIDSPKQELEKLKKRSPRAGDHILQVLSAIAQLVEPSRCDHARETGFHGLVVEVRQELGVLVHQCREECTCGDACSPIEGGAAT